MRTTAPVSIIRQGYIYVRLPAQHMDGRLVQITIEPNIRDGMPCVRGTRTPVSDIATAHESGTAIIQICHIYGMTARQVRESLDYINAPWNAKGAEQ